jgi:hypothetical protein
MGGGRGAEDDNPEGKKEELKPMYLGEDEKTFH